MTDFVKFSYDVERHQPLVHVRMPPTKTPRADLDLRIEAFGAEFDDAETLFTLFDGDDRFYTVRPLEGAVMFLDRTLSSLAYTVRAQHGPTAESEWVIELDERELKRLATARHHIAEQVYDELEA